MKPLNLINFFDSIPNINSYSQYGSSLEKMFKVSSFKHFIKTLKFKEEFYKKYLKEESVNKKKPEYDIYDIAGTNENKNNNEEDIFSLPYVNKSKSLNRLKLKIKNNLYFFHKKNPGPLGDTPDPLRYNPNFNSISKNIPSFKITNPIFNKNNIKKNDIINQELKKDKNNIILNISKSNKNYNSNKDKVLEDNINNSSNNNTLEKEKESRFITEIPISISLNINKNNNSKKNLYKNREKLPTIGNDSDIPHYLSKINKKRNYSNILNNNNNINNNNTIDNSNSFHNKNRAIDFSKMQSRSSKNFINSNSLKVPNFGYYHPKYNYVENRQININLNKKPIFDRSQKKHFLLKKILCSYQIGSNYKTIDNNKLNNSSLNKNKI